MTSNAQPAAKTVCDMTFFLCVGRPGPNLALGVEVPRRIEVMRIFAIDLRVAIQMPHVRDAHCTLWNEHPFVPVVFSGSVREADRVYWTPPQRLFDDGSNVGKVRIVGKGR